MGEKKAISYKGKKIIDTGLPQRVIKPIWLDFHKELRLKIADAIVNTQPKERKVINLIKLDISSILDEDLREILKKNIEETIKEEIKAAKVNNGGTITDDEKAKIEQDIYLDEYEGVTDYLDTAFGVSHRLAIGVA